MSEPTPKRPDPTRPAAPAAGERATRQVENLSYGREGKMPVAKRFEPPATDEAAPPKSSPVISKSYRVLELPPPPPIVAPPEADLRKATMRSITTRCPTASRRRRKSHAAEPPIELDALQIRTPERWSLLAPPRPHPAALGAVAGRSPAAKQRRRGSEHCDPRRAGRALGPRSAPARANTGRGADPRPDRAAGCRRDGCRGRSVACHCPNPWCGRSRAGALETRGDRSSNRCGFEI